jgi:predicted transcriptional regulator
MQLNLAQADIQSLKEELYKEKEIASQYKAIANANEQTLKEFNELNDAYRQATEDKIRQLTEENQQVKFSKIVYIWYMN